MLNLEEDIEFDQMNTLKDKNYCEILYNGEQYNAYKGKNMTFQQDLHLNDEEWLTIRNDCYHCKIDFVCQF